MLKRPFSIVRQYFCQMLDNTLAKRWAILLPNIEMLWQNIGLYLIYNRSALLINLHLDDRNVDMKVLRVFVGVRLVFGNPQKTNTEHHLKPLSYNRLRHDRCSMFDLFPKTQILDWYEATYHTSLFIRSRL